MILNTSTFNRKINRDCKICPAEENHLSEIVKMTNNLYRETNSIRFLNNSINTKVLSQLLNEGVEIYIAKLYSSDPIGFICISETVSPQVGGKYIIVNEIYVNKDYRNLHIGSTLIEYIKALAKSKGWKQIIVTGPSNSSWYNVIRFYSSRLFKYTGPVLSFRIN